MILTPIQRKALTSYVKWRERIPGTLELLASGWRAYLLLLVLVGMTWGSLVLLQSPNSNYALFLLGMLVGMILRDFGMYRRLHQVWPALSAVIEWKSMEEILEEDRLVNPPS